MQGSAGQYSVCAVLSSEKGDRVYEGVQSTAQCVAVQHTQYTDGVVQCSTVLVVDSTAQYGTVQISTVQHSPAQ